MTRKNTLTSRRSFIKKGAASVAFVAAAPQFITRSKAADNYVVVNTWGGSWTKAETKAFYKPFTEETGIEVKTSTPVKFAKLKAQVETGNYEWDVSSTGSPDMKRGALENLIEPLDWNIIDKDNANVPFYNNGVGYISIAQMLMYRTDKFPNGGPQSWADVWDGDKFPGKISLYNRGYTALGTALVADGVANDKVFPMDLERAFKSLDKIKPRVRVWRKGASQSQQLIQDGEVDIIQIPNGRAWQSIVKNNTPGEVVWNGAEMFPVFWYAAKGTPRRENAMRFLEYGARAKAQGVFCTELPYGPLNPGAFEHIPAEQASWLPTYPANLKQCYEVDADWLAPKMASIAERFAQWQGS